MKKTAKLLALLLACVLIVMSSGVAAIANAENDIATRAVSGSGQATGWNTTFYVYSPGSSVFCHAIFTVTNSSSNVMMSAWDPNGRLLTSPGEMGYLTVYGNGSTKFTFMNGPAGNYKVNFWTENGSNATVRMNLYDWW